MNTFWNRPVWYVAVLRCVIGAFVSTLLFLIAEGLIFSPLSLISAFFGIPVGILTAFILYRGSYVRHFPKLPVHFLWSCLFFVLLEAPTMTLMVRVFCPSAYYWDEMTDTWIHLTAGSGFGMMMFCGIYLFMYLTTLMVCYYFWKPLPPEES